MIIERAEIPVKAGQEDAFAAMMRERGLHLLRAADGCSSVRIGRGVENPETHLLLIEWESVDHHKAFTTTPEFDEFKAIAGPFFAGPSRMEHFAMN